MSRKAGDKEVMPFWTKTAEHTAQCEQVCLRITHHEMGEHVERVFKTKSLKQNTASHNNASWYSGTDGFLEHSPRWGKPAVQEARPPEDNSGCFGVSPSI